jgi:hypothetical protein
MARVEELFTKVYNEIRNISTVDFKFNQDRTLATIEVRYRVIKLTDTGTVLTTGRNAIFPTETRSWTVYNNTAQTITVKTSAGTGIAVPSGSTTLLRCDGTNIVHEFDIGTAAAIDTGTTSATIPLNGTVFTYLHGYIGGFIFSNNGTDPNNDIDISAGCAMDSTDTAMIVGSAMTKRLDATWAAGTNAGGLDTGTKAANTEYYIHTILKDSDNSGDYLFSTSRTAPTMPSGYTKFRHSGWCQTDGAGNIIAFICTETGGGGIEYQWSTPILDINLANTLTTTARLDAISVPTGIKVKATVHARIADATSTAQLYVSDPDTTDLAPSLTVAPLLTLLATTGKGGHGQFHVTTNTSRQIRSRCDIATADTYRVATLGFQWSRR